MLGRQEDKTKRDPSPERRVPEVGDLVGRAAEVRRLKTVLARVERGQGSTLFLTGEAGIGKTRLAREALALVQGRGFRVLQGRAHSVGVGVAYAPITGAIGPFLRTLDPVKQSTLVGGLSDLSRLFGGLRLPSPEPLGDPALEKARLFEAVACLIERLARESSLVLFMDDLQWADAASLELFHYVARGIAGQRVLLLATCTSPQLDVARGLRPMMLSLQRAGLAEEMIIARLDAPTVALLARSLLDEEPPAALLDLLDSRAGGTPLYIEALIRAFVDTGKLRRRMDGWELDPDAESSLPPTVRELVRQRLDGLEPACRRALETIAVVGIPASHALLNAASGLEDVQVLQAIHGLRSAGLVAEEVDGLDVVYRVTHPLVQEVAYAELPEMVRRRMHAAVAGALERTRPDDLERLAHHYRGAGAEADQGRALAVLLAAGDRARETFASDEAARYFVAALALVRGGQRPKSQTGDVDSLLPVLLQRLGEAWERVGELGAAVAVWNEALTEYERLEEVSAVGHLRRPLALAEWDRGHFDAARVHVEAGLLALAGCEPSPELVDLHHARITLLTRVGDTSQAMVASGELLNLAERLGSPRARAKAHIARCTVLFEKWDMKASWEQASSALDAAEVAEDPLLMRGAHEKLAAVAGALGYHRLARRHAEACLDLARRLRAPSLELYPHNWLFLADFCAGEWDAALSRNAKALSLARRLGNSRAAAFLLRARAMALAWRGDLDGAEACLVETLGVYGGGSRIDRHVLGFVPVVEMLLALERGQATRAHAIAEKLFQSGEQDATVGLPPAGVPLGLALLAQTQIAIGEPEAALATARRLSALQANSRLRGTGEFTYVGAVALRAEGLARQALGESGVALSCLAQATAAFQTLEMPFEYACARLEWGIIASLSGAVGNEPVIAAAMESLAVFERLGARRFAQRARQLCYQLGVHPPAIRRARASGDLLSAREVEVARLVVEGHTTAEIARRLFISQHTATTHLRRIYARLGINSRAALARYAMEAGLMGRKE